MKIKFSPFWLLKQLFRPGKMILKALRGKIASNIRIQLIVTFIFCCILAGFAGAIISEVMEGSWREAQIDYTRGRNQIDGAARKVADKLSEKSSYQLEDNSIQELIDNAVGQHRYKLLISDVSGKVLYKSTNAAEGQVDLHSVIRSAMNLRIGENNQSESLEFFSFYPSVIKQTKVFVIGTGIPEANIVYRGGDDEAILAAIASAFCVFVFFFYLFTKRKMKYIEELAAGLRVISTGNLDFRVVNKGADELGSLARNINSMAEELKCKIEEERRAEKMKNELITNISHDLRTPLTSIMGYLRLVSEKKYEDDRQLEEFIGIAYGKSEKLKTLIEDLFEYTKISNKGVKLNITSVDIGELLEQLIEELVPAGEERGLQFVKEIPYERMILLADADLIARVFENLLMNAVRYSYKPGNILVSIQRQHERAIISIENSGDPIPPEELPNLFNRFYRLEKSRSTDTGGSGLGLAIAKNIVELHYGDIRAECEGNRIKFFVELPLG